MPFVDHRRGRTADVLEHGLALVTQLIGDDEPDVPRSGAAQVDHLDGFLFPDATDTQVAVNLLNVAIGAVGPRVRDAGELAPRHRMPADEA